MSALIEKGAELVGVTPQVFVITIAILVVLFIIIFIKITLDEKKGVNSQEKAEIRKIIDNLVPNGNQYVAAYAHSKEVYGGARMRREVYHYYAIGFVMTSRTICGWFPLAWKAGRLCTPSQFGPVQRM